MSIILQIFILHAGSIQALTDVWLYAKILKFLLPNKGEILSSKRKNKRSIERKGLSPAEQRGLSRVVQPPQAPLGSNYRDERPERPRRPIVSGAVHGIGRIPASKYSS